MKHTDVSESPATEISHLRNFKKITQVSVSKLLVDKQFG